MDAIKRLSIVPDVSFSDDTDRGIFSGYAAVFGEVPHAYNPYGGKIVLSSGAFQKTLNERSKPFKVLWNHNANVPIGNTTEIAEDGRGLKFSAQLNMDLQAAREVFSNLKAGVVDEMSIGFDIKKYEQNNETGDIDIKEVRLKEISPVSFPANPAAQISSVMSSMSWNAGAVGYRGLEVADMGTSWDESGAAERVREWADNNDNDYRSAYLWADSNEGKLSECKLPIGDIINGNLVAVPGGIFAAAAIVESATSGIAEEDLLKCRMVLGRYYDDMGIVSPWRRGGALGYHEIDALIKMKLGALRTVEPVTTRDESESTHNVDEPLIEGLQNIVRIINEREGKNCQR